MQAWDVIRNNQVIDTVFFQRGMTLHQVRNSLIEHDRLGVDIIVRKAN